MTKQEEIMFGCDMTEYRRMISESNTYKHSGGGMILVSLLSDVQELLTMDNAADASKLINRVKALIMDADDNQQIKFPG